MFRKAQSQPCPRTVIATNSQLGHKRNHWCGWGAGAGVCSPDSELPDFEKQQLKLELSRGLSVECWKVIQRTGTRGREARNQEEEQKWAQAPGAKVQVQVQSTGRGAAPSDRDWASYKLSPWPAGSSSDRGSGRTDSMSPWSCAKAPTPIQRSFCHRGSLHEQSPGASPGQGLWNGTAAPWQLLLCGRNTHDRAPPPGK